MDFEVDSEVYGSKGIGITLSVGGSRVTTFVYMTDSQALRLAAQIEREVKFARELKSERDEKKRAVLIDKHYGKKSTGKEE